MGGNKGLVHPKMKVVVNIFFFFFVRPNVLADLFHTAKVNSDFYCQELEQHEGE